jgi:hypothetical protein
MGPSCVSASVGGQQKRVLQTFVHAGASNLSGIIDAVGFDQHPAGFGGDQFVEILNLTAAVDEGVIRRLKRGLADDHSRVIDTEAPSGAVLASE